MKSFLKISASLLFMGIATASFSQATDDGSRVKRNMTETVNKLDRAVTLTEEQRPLINAMAREYFTKVEEIKADQTTYADKRKALDANYEIKLKEVLTADQWVKLEDYKAANKK